jgi:hypothetical protein
MKKQWGVLTVWAVVFVGITTVGVNGSKDFDCSSIFGSPCNECNDEVKAAFAAPRNEFSLTEVYVSNCTSSRVSFNIQVPGAGWASGPWLEPGEYMNYQYPHSWSGSFCIQWLAMDDNGYYSGDIGEPACQDLGQGWIGDWTLCRTTGKNNDGGENSEDFCMEMSAQPGS